MSSASSQAFTKSAWPESTEPDDSDRSWPSPEIGYPIERVSCGIATGWLSGHEPPTLAATWLVWSSLSRLTPSQQSGKTTLSRSGASAGQVGGSTCGSPWMPHPQPTNDVDWGVVAVWSPAIIISPCGYGCTVVGSMPGPGR